MEIILGILAVIFIIVFIISYSTLIYSFIVYKFWYWFLLPVFTTLPEINYVQALGISLFISLFKNHSSSVIKDEYKDKNQTFSNFFLTPLIILLFGWIVYNIIK